MGFRNRQERDMIPPIVPSIASIVHDTAPITLVGGGEATVEDIESAVAIGPRLVAADSGAALVVAAGRMSEAVIGDFDSLPETLRNTLPRERLHPLPGQDDTDFGKALARIDAPLVLGVGFGGGRVDHQLAVYHTLAKMPERPCLLLDRTEAICLAPPRVTLPCEAGEIVSLFPLTPVTGRSTGLHWPIDGIDFAPEVFVGTSNRATGPVTIEMDAPGMLLIAPRRHFRPLALQLAVRDRARWPARA